MSGFFSIIFQSSRGECIVSFSSFLGIQESLYAEVMPAMAIKLDWRKDFRRIWLECDSSLLYQTFS